MTHFNTGDRVVRTGRSNSRVTQGETYVVRTNTYGDVTLETTDGEGVTGSWFADLFTLAPTTPPTEDRRLGPFRPGDRVRQDQGRFNFPTSYLVLEVNADDGRISIAENDNDSVQLGWFAANTFSLVTPAPEPEGETFDTDYDDWKVGDTVEVVDDGNGDTVGTRGVITGRGTANYGDQSTEYILATDASTGGYARRFKRVTNPAVQPASEAAPEPEQTRDFSGPEFDRLFEVAREHADNAGYCGVYDSMVKLLRPTLEHENRKLVRSFPAGTKFHQVHNFIKIDDGSRYYSVNRDAIHDLDSGDNSGAFLNATPVAEGWG